MNKLQYALAVALTALSAQSAEGQSIFQGKKGPTNFQLDERVSFSRNEQSVDALANTLILKYWDNGKWIFVNIPYRFIETPNGSNDGLGDVSVGAGPRAIIGNTEMLPYFALVLPTGETGTITTGNGRFDVKIGAASTSLFYNGNIELTLLAEHNFTGENARGINPPNETTAGFLAGAKVSPRLRIATGLTDLV